MGRYCSEPPHPPPIPHTARTHTHTHTHQLPTFRAAPRHQTQPLLQREMDCIGSRLLRQTHRVVLATLVSFFFFAIALKEQPYESKTLNVFKIFSEIKLVEI